MAVACLFLTFPPFCSVGAVGKDGLHASYSSTGAALFLTAPGGDRESFTNNIVALPGGGCHEATIGTSFSTPVAAGVVALVLQANPNLSWRDVQGILATTSQKMDADDPSWSTNAAGIPHSYLYGFGVIDANAAVTAAQTWEFYSSEVQLLAESGTIDLAIPEYPDGPVSSTVSVSASTNFVTESVVVYLDISHSSRGDLDVILISPSGTESLVHPGQRPENTPTDERWKLMTVRNWNEPANGDWTLRIIDQSAGDLDGCGDIPDWSVLVDSLEIDCQLLSVQLGVCANGAQSSNFFDVFTSAVSGITDPAFDDANGVGPADACCACGGGIPVTSTADLLKSWRLMVYGHESTSATATVPTPTPPSSPSSAMAVSVIAGLALALIGGGLLLIK